MWSWTRAAFAVLEVSWMPPLACAQDGYADFSGVKIRYVDRGQGAPVVLLHGGTSSLESWITYGVVDKLEKDFRGGISPRVSRLRIERDLPNFLRAATRLSEAGGPRRSRLNERCPGAHGR